MKRYLVALLVLAISTMLAGDMKKVDLTVSGMHCSHCTEKVKSAIEKVNDVQRVDVNLKKGRAVVMLAANSTTNADLLAKAVADAGFGASYRQGTETKTIAAVKTSHDDKDCDEKVGDQGGMDCSKDGNTRCCEAKSTRTKTIKK